MWSNRDFCHYWNENKDRINAIRRERYRKKPGLRGKQRRRALARYRSQLPLRAEERQAKIDEIIRNGAGPIPEGRRFTRLVEYLGVSTRIYSSLVLARRLGVTPRHLREFWGKNRAILDPILVDRFGRGWWSAEQVGFMLKMFKTHRAGCLRLSDFGKLLQQKAAEKGI